jgi:four helix bundle protein
MPGEARRDRGAAAESTPLSCRRGSCALGAATYLSAMKYFDHERLDVYAAAIDFVALADDIVEHLPRGRAYLADQLQRAATSIALNIAEGAGEFSGPEKARFYRMAKRSATECGAVLDVVRRLDVSPSDRLGAGRDLLLRIVSMLTKLARND